MAEQKKRVLFICPAFFGYEISIKNALIENGYEVDFFDERTSNNSFAKAIFRVKKSLLNRVINSYYDNILEKIKLTKYDYFLLIKGEVVPERFISEFKRNNPGAKLIYYTYDSFNNNNSNSVYILKHFDTCYSFDFEDVKNNPSLKLKHLFYTNEYISRPDIADRKYFISFVGSLHSARYTIIRNLFSKLEHTFTFFYMPAKWFFLLEKLLKKDYRRIKWAEVSFNKLSGRQVADIFKSSKSVVDIQRFGQTGLTMRTFEVLAAGAILITTNPYVKHADFYNADRIIILDDVSLPISADEVKTKIKAAGMNNFDEAQLKKYFINNWVKEFFE